MTTGERIYQGSTRAFSLIFIAIGLVLLVLTLANGGGLLSTGVLLGLAFLAVGLVRGWLAGGAPPWRRASRSDVRAHGGNRRDRTRGRTPS